MAKLPNRHVENTPVQSLAMLPVLFMFLWVIRTPLARLQVGITREAPEGPALDRSELNSLPALLSSTSPEGRRIITSNGIFDGLCSWEHSIWGWGPGRLAAAKPCLAFIESAPAVLKVISNAACKDLFQGD